VRQHRWSLTPYISKMSRANTRFGDYEVHYLVRTGRIAFNVTISSKNQSGIFDDFVVFVGGKLKGCVIITGKTKPTEERYRDFIDHTTAIITNVTYSNRCNVESTLEKGQGTKTMLNLAMNIVKHYFPLVTRFALQDKSNIACNT